MESETTIFWNQPLKRLFSPLEGMSYILLFKQRQQDFLALNGIELSYTQKELYETILDIAAGKLEYEELLSWILEHQN